MIAGGINFVIRLYVFCLLILRRNIYPPAAMQLKAPFPYKAKEIIDISILGNYP